MSEADKFNFTVRELRILLNKLSTDNFDNVHKKTLHDQSLTQSQLTAPMKAHFTKDNTNSLYHDITSTPCILFF